MARWDQRRSASKNRGYETPEHLNRRRKERLATRELRDAEAAQGSNNTDKNKARGWGRGRRLPAQPGLPPAVKRLPPAVRRQISPTQAVCSGSPDPRRDVKKSSSSSASSACTCSSPSSRSSVLSAANSCSAVAACCNASMVMPPNRWLVPPYPPHCIMSARVKRKRGEAKDQLPPPVKEESVVAPAKRSSPPPRQLRVKLTGAGNCTRKIPDDASSEPSVKATAPAAFVAGA